MGQSDVLIRFVADAVVSRAWLVNTAVSRFLLRRIKTVGAHDVVDTFVLALIASS